MPHPAPVIGTYMHMIRSVTLILLLIPLAGCIQLRAPDKPIEITLNVNIRQEVVVRLEKDVQDLIKKNPGIF
jgi:lipoprotein NlpI